MTIDERIEAATPILGVRGAAIRVLLIGFDRVEAAWIASVVGTVGGAAEHVADSVSGVGRALTAAFDVVVVDQSSRPLTGLDVVRKLREESVWTPVMMFAASGSVGDRVSCLRAGADDCLDKQVAHEEFMARIRAVHRRGARRVGFVRLGAATADVAGRQVVYDDGGRVLLTPQECALIAALGAEPGRVVSRDRLHALVFPGTSAKSIVDTYVYYVRRKLGRGVIRTVHSIGYRLGEAAVGSVGDTDRRSTRDGGCPVQRSGVDAADCAVR